jgi:hypothetical protein
MNTRHQILATPSRTKAPLQPGKITLTINSASATDFIRYLKEFSREKISVVSVSPDRTTFELRVVPGNEGVWLAALKNLSYVTSASRSRLPQ